MWKYPQREQCVEESDFADKFEGTHITNHGIVSVVNLIYIYHIHLKQFYCEWRVEFI